jgi:hypothetical protein
MSVSVQRKEVEGAQALYQEILQAMRSTTPIILELTCEKQTDKKVAIFSDAINAVIVSDKAGTATAGKVPGFFAAVE